MLPHILHKVARTYLNETGLQVIEECLLTGNHRYAQAYLAGALGVLWENAYIPEDEAEKLYKILGLSTEYLTACTFEKIN
jgi:hypothetical protein